MPEHTVAVHTWSELLAELKRMMDNLTDAEIAAGVADIQARQEAKAALLAQAAAARQVGRRAKQVTKWTGQHTEEDISLSATLGEP